MKACIVLHPDASKRLIAKGVVALPAVKRALTSGIVVITLGTTNALVAEEVLGNPVDRGAFVTGFIDDRWNINARLGEAGEMVLKKGKAVALSSQQLLDSLSVGDVIIKGGNALDPWGTVGVLMGSPTGGTVGRYLSCALARGVDLILPIGLEKAIHSSITDVARELGSGRLDLTMGLPCGMQPIVGRVVTEIDALETLFPVEVTQIAAGGIGKGAGSVSLLIKGEEKAVRAAFDLVQSLLSESGPHLTGSA
jgi:hypothetical protein